MSRNKLTLVLFGGAWGNNDAETIHAWMGAVDQWVKRDLAPQAGGRGFTRIAIRVMPVRKAPTRRRFIGNAVRGLADLPRHSAIAVCYSAGANDFRRVAAQCPDLFRGAVFVGGLERTGLGWRRFLTALRDGWAPFFLGFLTGKVDIRPWESCMQTLFGNGMPISAPLLRTLKTSLRPEPMEFVLTETPLRFLTGTSVAPPFPGQIIALTGEYDFFASDAAYHGEQVKPIVVNDSGHALPLEWDKFLQVLSSITTDVLEMLPAPKARAG